VLSCKEKAQFLLKFGGLQRISDKSDRENRRSKWLGRKQSWQKSASNENLAMPFHGTKQVKIAKMNSYISSVKNTLTVIVLTVWLTK